MTLLGLISSTIKALFYRFLSKKEFHALPVVDGGKIVGIVTTTDLINYLLECIDG